MAAGQDAIPADGGIAFICLCVFIKNALAGPPMAATPSVIPGRRLFTQTHTQKIVYCVNN